ncbi:MAG: sulfatase-like hydrolase/transferase [Planctomycetota bacterium]
MKSRFFAAVGPAVAAIVAALTPGFGGLARAEESPATSADPPNVVLIYIDDLGYGDVGCYGCEDIPTPQIDRLAEEGVRLTASYITNPPCCPSRCSLLMGQYAQRFGKYGMSRGLPIPEDRPTLAAYLSDRGYKTGQIGKWDVGTPSQHALAVGFDEVAQTPPKKIYTDEEIAALPKSLRKKIVGKDGRSKYWCVNAAGETVWLTDDDGDRAVEFINRHADEPFFLYWSPHAVHSFNDETPERLMNRTTATGKRRKLAGAIVSVDDQVGKILAALERHELRENTLVIFTSDNGPNPTEGGTATPYAGGKNAGTQQEGWVRVPTVLSLPGTLPRGTVYDGLVANFDFCSTIAQFTTNAIPAHCDGVDLIPRLTGDNREPAHEMLFWLNNQPDDAPRRHLIAVRWRDWRLYRQRANEPWRLFDLAADPTEQTDLAAEKPDLVQKLAAAHAEWAATLAPLETVPKPHRGTRKDGPNGPGIGHGWAVAD